jgi:hypothetical protein
MSPRTVVFKYFSLPARSIKDTDLSESRRTSSSLLARFLTADAFAAADARAGESSTVAAIFGVADTGEGYDRRTWTHTQHTHVNWKKDTNIAVHLIYYYHLSSSHTQCIVRKLLHACWMHVKGGLYLSVGAEMHHMPRNRRGAPSGELMVVFEYLINARTETE